MNTEKIADKLLSPQHSGYGFNTKFGQSNITENISGAGNSNLSLQKIS